MFDNARMKMESRTSSPMPLARSIGCLVLLAKSTVMRYGAKHSSKMQRLRQEHSCNTISSLLAAEDPEQSITRDTSHRGNCAWTWQQPLLIIGIVEQAKNPLLGSCTQCMRSPSNTVCSVSCCVLPSWCKFDVQMHLSLVAIDLFHIESFRRWFHWDIPTDTRAITHEVFRVKGSIVFGWLDVELLQLLFQIISQFEPFSKEETTRRDIG